MLNYSALMGIVFMLVTFFRPDTMNKTLMPALQSVWFIPHVIVYIFAYAMLGMASLTAVYGIYLCKKQRDTQNAIAVTDQLIKIGYVFLTFGLLFGALWAKEAWGHYWTWDPKETWAFITWLAYLVYIHYKYKHKEKQPFNSFLIVIIAFFVVVSLLVWSQLLAYRSNECAYVLGVVFSEINLCKKNKLLIFSFLYQIEGIDFSENEQFFLYLRMGNQKIRILNLY
ncbi:cytochrome c biogenesis protein CcsA [Capnocytophaga canimorsus]|nr:cytochrome c biogenesis protein CcsA [Capnocytophaga canimorsus]WGU70395.1 cytochrome c biogenesis protein CcsA [Capnocytophaga canimorsus]